MAKFWSNISLFFQIAIVVGVVLALSFFDPFGIFNSKKLQLENTPISVQSVREIGQLISAEYYGEVLTSLHEALIEDIKVAAVDDAKEFESVKELYQAAITDFYEERNAIRLGVVNRGNKLYDLFYHRNALLTEHPYYQVFIEYFLDNTEYKKERKLLKAVFKMNQQKFDSLIKKIDALDTKEIEKKKNDEIEVFTADKQNRKSQIVVLGRGSVKAGINFEEFTDQNFKYDPSRKVIHLIGIKPEILTSDINPWFIPEKKVKGFEIVLMTKKANNPAYMLKVKEQALKKLKQKAIQAGIVQQAKKNAERNLKNFFSLLIPEGIDEVIIHDDFLSYFDQSFVTDSISTEIMRSLDSLMISRYQADSIEVVELKNDLLQRKIYLSNSNTPYEINRYSANLHIIEDNFLSVGDVNWLTLEKERLYKTLADLKDTNQFLSKIKHLPTRLDSIWFYPSEIILKKYQDEIDDYLFKEFEWYQIISDNPRYLANEKAKYQALKRRVYEYMITRKIFDFENFSSIVKENTEHIVKGKTTFSLDSNTDEIKEIPIEDHMIKYENTLDNQLNVLDGSIGELIKKDSVFASISDLKYANNKIDIHWGNDQESAESLVEKMKTEWKFLYLNDTLNIERYSQWFAFINNDTLSFEFISLIKNEQLAFKNAQEVLNNTKIKKLNLPLVNRQNETLDQAWFYPPDEVIDQHMLKANKEYGENPKRRKARRKLTFLAVELQKYILKKRIKAHQTMLKKLLERVQFIQVAQGKVVEKKANGSFSDLPSELYF